MLGALRETTSPDARREGGTADAAAVELSVLSVLVRALRCVLVQIFGMARQLGDTVFSQGMTAARARSSLCSRRRKSRATRRSL